MPSVTILGPVQHPDSVCDVSLVSTLRAEYSPDQQTIIGCPTQEQLAAILASVMHVQVRNIGKIV